MFECLGGLLITPPPPTRWELATAESRLDAASAFALLIRDPDLAELLA